MQNTFQEKIPQNFYSVKNVPTECLNTGHPLVPDRHVHFSFCCLETALLASVGFCFCGTLFANPYGDREVPLQSVKIMITLGFLMFLIWGINPPSSASPTPFSGRAASYSQTDTRASQALQAKLKIELPSETGIHADVSSGIAILSGSASTLSHYEEAIDIATTLVGVRAVAPILTLQTHHPAPSQNELKKRIHDSLSQNSVASKHSIKIRIQGTDTVVLEGSAPSVASRYLIGEATKNVSGVKRVINQIQVSAQENRPHEEILQEIRALLRRDPWIPEERVELTFKNDTLVVGGELGIADRVGRVVNHIRSLGLSNIDRSRLTSKGKSLNKGERYYVQIELPDAEVQEAILEAYQRIPSLNSAPPIVGVANQEVTLSGKLASQEAKELAVIVAKHALGAQSVQDKISVTDSNSGALSR